MQISEAAGGSPAQEMEPCRFPKLEECAHFHYERVQLPKLAVTLQTNMDQSLHSQHTNNDDAIDWHMVQVTSADECWLVQRNYENFKMLDAQLHQCIYDRKISQLPDLSNHPSYGEDIEMLLIEYLTRLTSIADNSVNCGPVLNWFQMDNKGHRLLVPSEESRSINTPAVAAAYSVRRYVSQARDELNLEVGDMISVIDMASPAESMWWRGKRGFQVGFFPQHCVHIIGDKVPRNMPLPPPVIGSLALTPVKPVLRKHGKLIAFFRSFILNRPSRRRLKQSGILKERVFGCDLGEHLLNSGHDMPTVLKCCTEFIEKHGIVDGIYRLSGVTSNIQKLRNAFDEDRIPDLYTDEILQDIHSVASLLKMYFRELPNPLCTYQLYQSFVSAVQGCNSIQRNSLTDRDRLLKMREAVQKLPPPHYRTLEYLMRHLSRVAQHGPSTGMTTRNIAIVWAPNLLRCAELEVGGVAALQGVGVQAVVTEFLICYADLIFCDHLPSLNNSNFDVDMSLSPKRNRPKSLAISTPTKLITLEEARTKHLLTKTDDSGYIEVGGGPNNLPKKYHTVIELPSGARKRSLSKRSPLGWRSFFSKSRSSSRSQGSLTKNRKAATSGNICVEKSVTEIDLAEMKRKLRPVKSAESLTSGHSEPASTEDVLGPLHCLNKPPGHNRSVSHDSYFDMLQTSQHNSDGSLYDLSEIQLNFELEESEMRIFSEDESLVSSPRIQKDPQRRVLARARPEDFSSTNNSTNPSPKKQARVVLSPDITSRKRTRLEDQLSDIQYIDCNTPDNTCVISTTTAVIHCQPTEVAVFLDSYRPKNKSPRNLEIQNKRQSLNLEKGEQLNIPKSLTESNIRCKLGFPSNQSSTFPSPQSPIYKQLDDSSTNSTPDFTPSPDIKYENLDRFADEVETAVREKPVYENVVSPISKKSSPTYENVLTTISITYRSPSKSPKSSISASDAQDNDSVYEDVRIVNPEQAVVPTSSASLPLQQASQPDVRESAQKETNSLTSLPGHFTTLSLPEKEANEQRPKSLSALEDLNKRGDNNLQASFCAVYNIKAASEKQKVIDPEKSVSLNLISAQSPISSSSYKLIDNIEQLSLTDLSLSEVVHSSTENTSQSSISFPISPSKNSQSPNVSPMLFCDGTKTLSQDILSSLSPSVASLLESKTRNSSGCSLIEDNKSLQSNEGTDNFVSLSNDVRHGNPEYLKLTDNNISSNEDDISPVRFFKAGPLEASILVGEKSDNDTLIENRKKECSAAVSCNEISISSRPNSQLLQGKKEPSYSSNSGEKRPAELNIDPLRPKSVNLIEFSPTETAIECSNRNNTNEKRKSSETELMDDENTVYQQVKYFRRSIHEINALLDLDSPPIQPNQNSTNKNTDGSVVHEITDYTNIEAENYDSLEVANVRIYENVETPTSQIELNIEESLEQINAQIPEYVDKTKCKQLSSVRSLTSHFELKESNHQKPPIFKRNEQETVTNPVQLETNKQGDNIKRCSVRDSLRTSKCDFGSNSSVEGDRVQKIVYDRGSLPPCLRAKHMKNAIKTRSLDEDAFIKEFGVTQPLERRKSVDENFGSKLNTLPKLLNQPKPIPIEGEKLDMHLAHSTDNIFSGQKLNRERIEKYKEERRKFLHDKYRSESFKEDKDSLLSRFKHKVVKGKEDEYERELPKQNNDVRVYKPEPERKNVIDSEAKSIKITANEFNKASLACDSKLNKLISKQDKLGSRTNETINDFRESIKYKTALFESQANQSKQSSTGKISGDNKFNSIRKVQEFKSPMCARKNYTVKETDCDVMGDCVPENDFIRNKRMDEDDDKHEKRRHTYESRERETESDRVRRISLESRSPRKDTKSPSYCIKDMKAIFESKSQQ